MDTHDSSHRARMDTHDSSHRARMDTHGSSHDAAYSSWSLSGWLTSTALATAAFWSIFGACVDAPVAADEPTARAIVAWDPLACGDPHRVIVELDADDGEPIAASAPCAVGAVTIDAPHFGLYHGRVYAWTAGATMRSVAPVDLTLDAPITRWEVPTPR